MSIVNTIEGWSQPFKSKNLMYLAAFLVILLPLLPVSTFYIHIAGSILIWVLLTTSLNLLVGYLGAASFAHGMLFGIGSYTVALMTIEMGLPVPLVVLLGGIFAAAIALFIALPSLRLTGIYFSIITIATQIIYEDLIRAFSDITGGVQGLGGIGSFPTFFGVGSLTASYYGITFFVLISIAILYRVLNSYLGDTFYMIRQDEMLTKHLGYNTPRYKILGFVISAFFAGIAGGLFAQHNTFIDLTNSDVFISFQIFIFIIIGGSAANFWGPILAAALLTLVEQQLAVVAQYRGIVFALILLVIIMRLPGGLASIDFRDYWERFITTVKQRKAMIGQSEED